MHCPAISLYASASEYLPNLSQHTQSCSEGSIDNSQEGQNLLFPDPICILTFHTRKQPSPYCSFSMKYLPISQQISASWHIIFQTSEKAPQRRRTLSISHLCLARVCASILFSTQASWRSRKLSSALTPPRKSHDNKAHGHNNKVHGHSELFLQTASFYK